jgi:hypothetical protein
MPDTRVRLDTGVVTISAPNEIRVLCENAREVLTKLEKADAAGNDRAVRELLEQLLRMANSTYRKTGRPANEEPLSREREVSEYFCQHGMAATRRKYRKLSEATVLEYHRRATKGSSEKPTRR